VQRVTVLHRGSRATVDRPDATSRLLLEIRRPSGRDLEDCELVLESGEGVDGAGVPDALATLPGTGDRALAGRRERLRTRLGGE